MAERDSVLPAVGGLDEELSYAELAQRIEVIAVLLAGQGIHALAIAADNSVDWVAVDLAAQQAEIPIVPLPPFFSAGQVAHVLADSGVDAIVADESGARSLARLSTRSGQALTSRLSLRHLNTGQRQTALPFGTAKISYTSGTTGSPKGVCLRQAAMDRVAASLCQATKSLQIKRHLCLLPLATLLENIGGVYAPLLAGAEVLVPSLAETGILGAAGLDIAQLIRCLRSAQPQSVILLPQMLAGLVAAIERGEALPESLKFAAVGGGVVGASLLERAERVGLPAFEGYGLTECGSVVSLNTPAARRIGSVGQPLPHCRVRIGSDSEIYIAGASMAGYLGSVPEADAEIATGDIGYFDDDGYLVINGRKKNVLITSFGRNLSPEWVEATLTATGSIAQAVLVGDGKPWNVAVIVAAPGVAVEAIERDIAAANATLPDYARIRRWIRATAPFSAANELATSNGRPRRAAIQHQYRDEIEACYAETIGCCA
jgi:long-subunit acyl-CoA synthetase (AMP-forming)